MPTVTTRLDADLKGLLHGDPEIKADPFPLYDELLRGWPVYDLGPLVVLTGYDLLKEVFLNSTGLSNEMQRPGTSRVDAERAALPTARHQAMFDHCIAIERLFLEETDGEAHDRRRGICRRLFTRRRIAELEDATQKLVDELLDEMVEGGEVADFETFSYKLPAILTADLLGVPREDADQLVDWSATIVANIFGGQGLPALEAAFEAHTEFEQYTDAIIGDHRSGRRPTELVEALMGAEERNILTQQQLYSLFLEVELGGSQTSRGLLVGAAYELLRRPAQWRKLVEDPSLTVNMVEEAVRHVGPVQWTARIPRTDMELAGVSVPAEKTCLTMIAASNRDAAVFADPHEFDVERPNAKQHIGFGIGRHYCLGQALARLQARITFKALVTRFPHAELAMDGDDVEWAGQAQLRRVKSLPIRLGPDAAGKR
jgi:hypothetical protein